MKLVSPLAFRERNPSYLGSRGSDSAHSFLTPQGGGELRVGMCGMRAPCQLLLSLDEAIVKTVPPSHQLCPA